MAFGVEDDELGGGDSDSLSSDLFSEFDMARRVVKVIRLRSGLYEVEYSSGLVSWVDAETFVENEENRKLVQAFEAEEPLRKKRRKEIRDEEKRKESLSSIALESCTRPVLLRCFLWELALAFKPYYTTDRYAYTRKIVFRVNYSKKLSLEVLQRAAEDRFAPPLQRLRTECDRVFRHFGDVKILVYSFLGMPEKWPSDKVDLGRLVGRKKGDALEMSLPRRLEREGLRKMMPNLPGCWRKQNDHWWDYAGEDGLATSIARVENSVPSMLATKAGATIVRRLLRVEETPVDKTRPHSLELVARLDGAVVATLLVPHDATISQVGDWASFNVGKRFGYSLNGFCDYHVDGPIEHAGHTFSDLAVRVSAAEMKDDEKRNLYPFVVKEKPVVVHGSRAALLDALRAKASPSEIVKIDEYNGDREGIINSWINTENIENRPDYCTEERLHSSRSGITLCYNCAICDIVPMPEDCSPPMDVVYKRLKQKQSLGGRAMGHFAHSSSSNFEWSKTGYTVEVACLRRLPRLQNDDDYPVVKPCKTAPVYFPQF